MNLKNCKPAIVICLLLTSVPLVLMTVTGTNPKAVADSTVNSSALDARYIMGWTEDGLLVLKDENNHPPNNLSVAAVDWETKSIKISILQKVNNFQEMVDANQTHFGTKFFNTAKQDPPTSSIKVVGEHTAPSRSHILINGKDVWNGIVQGATWNSDSEQPIFSAVTPDQKLVLIRFAPDGHNSFTLDTVVSE